ncbi:MAG TPA: HAMP domain-containing sensor histidine kinase [Balneolales bacterium]|nr:HAMP domain-containing sensor histidine kinase [Balneolales bacterium]
MKIRYKITLWIAGAGVLASLVFSVIVLWEMVEQPFRLIDKDLDTMAGTVVRFVETTTTQPKDAAQKDSPFDIGQYWIKIYDDHMNVLYQSKLTRYTDLPFKNTDQPYMAERNIPRERIDLGQDRKNEVAFRIKIFNKRLRDRPCKVLIGKPVEKLEEEIVDLAQGIILGLCATTILLIGLSYYIAGKILTPISVINRMARDINNRSLDQRIPLGKSKDELYELSESLNRMFDRLQYSFAMQKQFIADASHELKSPITLLSLFMEDAVYLKDLPETFRTRLIRQYDILQRMRRLVKNLLDLSALEIKESMDFEELNLSELAKSVHEDFVEVVEARHIDVAIRIPEELRIMGGRDSLQRVLINLVDNAIKYNVDGGKIEITAEAKNDNVYLSVFNTGNGIPEKDIDRVFEQFYRVEKSRSSQYGGSGLGLTIVKRIIELHQGNITIESEPEAWTRVNIHLPNQVSSSSKK